MSLKIISFKIADPVKADAAQNQITEDGHLKIAESTYLVSTSKAIEILRRDLSPFFEKTDELFISKVPANGYITFHFGKKKRDWIEEKI
jgi:hypothetical protein